MAFGQQLRHLLQIIETAEKRQVVAGTLGELPGNQLDNRPERRLTVDKTGRDLADDADLQLVRVERRLNVDPDCVRRSSQQVSVIMPRAEGRGKQHGTARRRQA